MQVPDAASSSKPSIYQKQIVCVAAGLMGLVLLGSMETMEGKWLVALLGALLFWGVAILSGRIERFLFGCLFFAIPVNADFQIFKQVTSWHGMALPLGTPQMGLSVMDLMLLVLYPMWIGRLLTGRRRTVLWPTGATLLAMLILWGVLSMLNAPSAQLASLSLYNYVKAFLLFFYVANNVRSREDFLFVARCFVAGMVVESLIACAQQFNGANLGLEALGERRLEKEVEMVSGLRFRPGGTLGHPNSLGGYLAAVLPVALALHLATGWNRRERPKLMLFSLGLGSLALILSLCRSAWLSVALASAAVVVWTAMKQGKKFDWRPVIGLAALGAIASVAFAPLVLARWQEDDRGSTYSRVPQSQMAFGMIGSHPILGVGINNFGVTSHLYETYVVDPKTRGRVYQHFGRIHNVFLQTAIEIGVIGVLWFLFFIVRVLARGWQRIRRCTDLPVKWFLAGIFWSLIGRLLHDAVHTGDFALIPQIWVYAGLLSAAVWLTRTPPPVSVRKKESAA